MHISTREQLYASGRYPAQYEHTKPKSSGLRRIADGQWLVWGAGWWDTYSREESARAGLQSIRRNSRQARQQSPEFIRKMPTGDMPHVGVEIECVVPNGHLSEAHQLLGMVRGADVASDGSIRPPEGWCGLEVRILGRQGEEIARRVRYVCASLRKVGASVNKSCGLHVHLDCRPETGRSAEGVWGRLRGAQVLLMNMQPRSRRENQYCRPARSKRWETASRRSGVRANRYKAINPQAYRAHRTIEVRCHTGTIRAFKVNAWIELLVAIVKVGGEARPTKKYLKTLGLSDATMGYVLARLEAFGSTRWARAGGLSSPLYSRTESGAEIPAFPHREEYLGEYEAEPSAT